MADTVFSDAEFAAARERARQFEQDNPMATAARFDAASGRLVIDFANGSTLLVPARSLQDLEGARDEDLADVELHHDHFLRWERLDVDFTIPSLMNGIFGTAKFMDAQRRGGRSRSPAKAAAARANGAKGGRPRKTPPAA